MGDTPPTSPKEASPTVLVSPLTSYSIPMDEYGPAIPFFEAQQAFVEAERVPDEIILSEHDFTIWQLPPTPVNGSIGLQITPP